MLGDSFEKFSLYSDFMFVLAGCSATATEENLLLEKQVKTDEAIEISDQNVKKDVYVPNPQITDDLNLVTVGETVTDDKGEITLKSYKNINKTVNFGAVEMTIKDIKVMHYVPEYSMTDFFIPIRIKKSSTFLKQE